MKKTTLILGSLAAVFTQTFAVVPALAAVNQQPDGMSQVLTCSNPRLRDAGQKVTISYGGIQPHYSAEVSEISIAGSKVVLSVSQVTASMEGRRQVFTDSETKGGKFRLVYNPVHGTEDTSDTFNATLVTQYDSKSTTSELACESVSQ